MNIAIVEDNKQAQDILVSHIENCAKKLDIVVNIFLFNDGLEFVDKFDNLYDIIYFDVEMKYMDGMTAAQKIRSKDSEVLIVFVTNHAQVAIQGYSVEATDFLLKPLAYFTFEEHFKKIIKKITSRNKDESSIVLRVSGTIKRINQNVIKYVQSQGHYIDFVTLDNEYTIIDTMKNTETRLDNQIFFRCSNSYIVNFNYIDKVDKNTIYIDGEMIQISRSKKKEFIERFTDFLGEQVI
ncbi:response regulator transcription factor [Ruoffia tabacinasalis]|uniref:Response regulator transcription factor n=1 Tax=Ruoffia tabacinasalis TaxID=87458 RepID=A0A5R9DSJ4_9LACT|nr:LytTR family DNA-binding domain-containing protein [Ruoffia tabacinasalis]TLQ39712.1 response regulator transcription factor [Ruoffia tabacinasalis]